MSGNREVAPVCCGFPNLRARRGGLIRLGDLGAVNTKDEALIRAAMANPKAVIAIIAGIASAVLSVGFAHWQIHDLGRNQEAVSKRQSLVSERLEKYNPEENQRRINKLESQYEGIRDGQSQIKAEIGVVRTIVERLEKR